MSKFSTFLKLTTRQKYIFTSALFCLPVCHLAVNLFSLSLLMKIFGLVPLQLQPTLPRQQTHLKQVIEIAKIIKLAAINIPLLQIRCLAQAFIFLCLAGSLRKDCDLNLGTAYDRVRGKLSAHAWICWGEQIVLGDEGHDKYVHIASFN